MGTNGADTTWQDGVSERGVRIILSRPRYTLLSFNPPQRFWPDALLHEVYIPNLTPTSTPLFNVRLWPPNADGPQRPHHSILFSALTGGRHQVSHPDPLGSEGLVDLHGCSRPVNQLPHRGVSCRLVGFNGTKFLRMWNPADNGMHISSDARFLPFSWTVIRLALRPPLFRSETLWSHHRPLINRMSLPTHAFWIL